MALVTGPWEQGNPRRFLDFCPVFLDFVFNEKTEEPPDIW